jgi:hypothetical protein
MSRSVMMFGVVALVLAVGLERWLKFSGARDRLPQVLWPCVGLLLPMLVFMGLWTGRNLLVLGKPVIGSSLNGYNLFRQNIIIAQDNYFRIVGAAEARQQVNDLVARRLDLRGNENEAEMDGVYRLEALQVIATYPVRYLALSGYRFLPLWFDWRVEEAYGRLTPVSFYRMMLQQAVIMIGALFGLRGNLRRTWPLVLSVGVVSLAYMAVNAQMRYIVPVMPLVISLCALGVLNLARFLGAVF